MIAKRRSGRTLISYLTPPVADAGLYKGLLDLKALLERWRGSAPDAAASARRWSRRSSKRPARSSWRSQPSTPRPRRPLNEIETTLDPRRDAL
jgi:magnesium chelatase subunit H